METPGAVAGTSGVGHARSMRRSPALLLATLALGGCGRAAIDTPTYDSEGAGAEAQPRPGRRAESDVPGVRSKPFVWRVTRYRRTSHLMGTVHVGVTLEDALPEPLLAEARGARVVMLEIDPADLDPQVMLSQAQLPEDVAQSSFYSAAVWHEVANTVDRTMNEATLDRLRPWFTMLLLVQEQVKVLHDGNAPKGMDIALYEMSQARGVAVAPLETVEAQVEAIASIEDQTVVRMVTRLVQERTGIRDLEALLAAYRSGDLPRVEGVMEEMQREEEAPEFHEALIVRRNRAWLEPLRAQIDQGNAFVAVGLGHLIGEDGLLKKLSEAGYIVERVEL